jgi:uncharacterized metal-binding protein YceD (DUF177 family)
MTPPEFSRPMKLDQIGQRATTVELTAQAAERAALVVRFALLSFDLLDGVVSVSRDKSAVLVTGRFRARYAQACIATGEAVHAERDEPIMIRFMAMEPTAPDAEVELSGDDCDLMELEGQAVDLGEAVAQSFGLALDLYPRCPNADMVLRAVGVKQEEEVGAFSGLAALRDKLGKN